MRAAAFLAGTFFIPVYPEIRIGQQLGQQHARVGKKSRFQAGLDPFDIADPITRQTLAGQFQKTPGLRETFPACFYLEFFLASD